MLEETATMALDEPEDKADSSDEEAILSAKKDREASYVIVASWWWNLQATPGRLWLLDG